MSGKPGTLQPGNGTIGILGGGQLGRMLAVVARRYGYRVIVFTDSADSPGGQIADEEIVGAYTDTALLEQFAEKISVATYEFENIPVEAAEFLEARVPVCPNSRSLGTAQNRLTEREVLTSLSIPVAPHAAIRSAADLDSLPADFPFPAILKTATSGYDGKGQAAVASLAEAKEAWEKLQSVDCILEERIPFTKEFSLLLARGPKGEKALCGPIENEHENHILSVSRCPGAIPEQSATIAAEAVSALAEELDYIGVLAVEFFLLEDGGVLVNEIAPRTHNSGHFTIEGCITSQFEQHLRAIAGLPLGSFDLIAPTLMINLLGDRWQNGEPNFAEIASIPSTYIHLYGKAEARVGRKMGHITATASDGEALGKLEQKLKALL